MDTFFIAVVITNTWKKAPLPILSPKNRILFPCKKMLCKYSAILFHYMEFQETILMVLRRIHNKHLLPFPNRPISIRYMSLRLKPFIYCLVMIHVAIYRCQVNSITMGIFADILNHRDKCNKLEKHQEIL